MDVIDWLMQGDPAIRWQMLRDLTDASDDEVAVERARVETEGWGATLLGLRDPDGQWAGGAWVSEARKQGEEYLLQRHLFRSVRTGEVIRPSWLQFAWPTQWHYDLCVASPTSGLSEVGPMSGSPKPSSCCATRRPMAVAG